MEFHETRMDEKIKSKSYYYETITYYYAHPFVRFTPGWVYAYNEEVFTKRTLTLFSLYVIMRIFENDFFFVKFKRIQVNVP